MKILLPLFVCIQLIGQNNNLKLSYHYAGIGSSLGKKNYPVIEIHNNTITCVIESDTAYSQPGWTSKPKEFSYPLRKGSADSITSIIKSISDTVISEYNPCIQNGGIHFMKIKSGTKTVKFELTNTFNVTALKVAGILNSYIPKGYGIWATAKDIQETFDCWTYLRGKWVKQKPDEKQHAVKQKEETNVKQKEEKK
jgi:hypothetical protein